MKLFQSGLFNFIFLPVVYKTVFLSILDVDCSFSPFCSLGSMALTFPHDGLFILAICSFVKCPSLLLIFGFLLLWGLKNIFWIFVLC